MSRLDVVQNVKCLNALLFSFMLAKKYDKVKHVYLDLKKNQVLLRIRLIEFMLLSDYKDDN